MAETKPETQEPPKKDENPVTVESKAEDPKNTSNPDTEAPKQKEEPAKVEDGKEEAKEEKKEPVVRDFDPEKDAKDWHAIDLGSMLEKQNKKAKVVQAKPKIVTVKKAQVEKKLRLTKDLQFSITHLEKMNKGFTNRQKVNCFMNVMLQSLFACPGFFNLLSAIGSSSAKELGLEPNGVVMKLVYVQKHLDSRTQFDKPFANPTIDGETIFEQLLAEYNPLREQMDAQEFLSFLLDKCHEELKHLYVHQQQSSRAQVDEWATSGGWKEKSHQDNQSEILQDSIIRDIFGGVLKTEVTTEQTRNVFVQHEPFYVLNLELPK